MPTFPGFDGTSDNHYWPTGTTPNANTATPFLFSSPKTGLNDATSYAQAALEADLPRIEAADSLDPRFKPCDRTTGANCVNPPPGAAFYPFFTTRDSRQGCQWQLGGGNIPGTGDRFGNSSTAEFGPLLTLTYPGAGNMPVTRINDFRRVLNHNPC